MIWCNAVVYLRRGGEEDQYVTSKSAQLRRALLVMPRKDVPSTDPWGRVWIREDMTREIPTVAGRVKNVPSQRGGERLENSKNLRKLVLVKQSF